MGLIQTGFLAGLVALAIPILVHLLSRWQVRRLEFGTMQFLQEIIHDAAHRRRIRRWLLLATRMLLVALLVLLFARPYVPDRALGDGNRVRIALIDRSASMTMPGQSGRLLDDAIAAAVEAIQRAGSDTRVEWAWFDRHVEPMPEGTIRPKPPRATSGDTDYLAALSWARDRLSSQPVSDAEVILVTDLQQSGLSNVLLGTGELSFPRDVPVRIIDVSRKAANNVAIVNVAGVANQLPPNRPVKLLATLFNYGSLPAEELPITATLNNGQRTVKLKKTINIRSDQAEEVEFNFGILEPAHWQATVDIDIEDDMSIDNRRYTAVEVAKPIEILVIDPGSRDRGRNATSYYLVSALQQGNAIESATEAKTAGSNDSDELQKPAYFNRFSTKVLYLEDETPSLDRLTEPLVIVADAGSLSRRMVEQLESYVHRGGKLLVFAGGKISENVSQCWSDAKLAPGRLSRLESASTMPFRIVNVSHRSTMLEPFRDPQHGDLGRLAFASLLKTDINPTTDVLAWFDRDRPALTEHNVGDGRVAWFLSSVDSSAGNWTTSPLYLPLIQQMASDLLGLTGEGPIRFRNVGDTENDSVNVRKAVVPKELQAANSGPSKTESLYLEQPGFVARPEALYIVNSVPKESDPARIDAATFVKQFELTPVDEESTGQSLPVESQKRHELWPWLAAALILLLVVEFSLSNRTPA